MTLRNKLVTPKPYESRVCLGFYFENRVLVSDVDEEDVELTDDERERLIRCRCY
jgi:hypothetical protein